MGANRGCFNTFRYLQRRRLNLTDDQYIQDLEDDILISVISEENLDKLAEESMKSIMECDPNKVELTIGDSEVVGFAEGSEIDRPKQRRRWNPYDDTTNSSEETEQEFKEDLKYGMEQNALYPHCVCEICQEAHKKFIETPELFLEERWQDYLERKNYRPSEEEIAQRKARMEEWRQKGWVE